MEDRRHVTDYVYCAVLGLLTLRYDSVDSALEQHFLTGGTLQSFEGHQNTSFEYGIKFEWSSIHNCSIPDHIVFPSSSVHFTLYLLSCEATFLNISLPCPVIFFCDVWFISFCIRTSAFHCVCMLLSAFLLVVTYDIFYLQVTLCSSWNMGC